MALTNATTLADYGAGIGTQGATLKVDATNKRVGVGTDSPAGPEGSLQVGTGITFFGNTGIVSAIGGKFSGDFTVGGTLTYEDVANIDAVGIITAQSAVSIADSIFHTGDTDTSIRFPSAGTFTVSTNGTEAARVDSSQRLLVNTDSAMETFGSAALQVATTAGGTLVLGRNDTSVSADNGLGAIYFDTKAGGSYAESAVIAAEADADQGSSDYPSRLVFKTTADGASSVTERLRISSTGIVKIGSNTLITPNTDADNFVIDTGDVDSGLSILSATTGRIYFGDAASTDQGSIRYVHVDDSMRFETNSTEKLRITSAGLVGIGTDNPPNRLSVNNVGYTGLQLQSNRTTATDNIGGVHWRTVATDVAYIQSLVDGTIKFRNTSALTERLRIDTSGRLLVNGTSSTSPDGFDSLIQVNADNHEGSITIGRHTANGNGPALLFQKSRSGTATPGNGVVSDGDTLGTIRFYGSDGTDRNSFAANIGCEVDGTPGSNDMPGALTFSTTADGSASSTERMRIDSGGRLLVGTTSARQANGGLQVESTAGNSFVSITRNVNSDGGVELSLQKSRGSSNGSFTSVSSGDEIGRFNFNAADGTADIPAARITASVDGTPGTNDMPGRLIFSTTSDGASTPTERLRITSEGELLISNSGNRFLSLDRTNASSGTGEFNVNVESDSQVSISYDDGAPLVIGTSSSPRTQAGFTERLRIDSSGNLKLADTTLGPPSSGAPPETFFVGRRAAIRSVSTTATLDGSGNGSFNLGRLHYSDDESFELFMSICINNDTNLRTSYCKAFCQKVRGTGLTDFFIDRQDSAASGFSVSSLSSTSAQGTNGHGLLVNVTGGSANTEYRITMLVHSVSKNNLY